MSRKPEETFFDAFEREYLKTGKPWHELKPMDQYHFVQYLNSISPIATDIKKNDFLKQEIIDHLAQIEFLARDIHIFHVLKNESKKKEIVEYINHFPFFVNPEKWVKTTSLTSGREQILAEVSYYGFISKWWEGFLHLNKRDCVKIIGKQDYICWASIIYSLTYLDVKLILLFKNLRKKNPRLIDHDFEKKTNRLRFYSMALNEIFYERYKITFKFTDQRFKNLFDNDYRKKELRRSGFYSSEYVDLIDKERYLNKGIRGTPFSFSRFIKCYREQIQKELDQVLARKIK